MRLLGAHRAKPWGVLRALTLALSCWLCGVTHARAQTPPPPTQVVLHAGALVRDDPQVYETLRELLSRVGLELVTPSRAREDRVLAWVDVEGSGEGALVIVRSPVTDTYVRREVERAETNALFRETLAHVIFGIVEPLASDRTEAELDEPAPKPSPAEPPPRERPDGALSLSSPRKDDASSGRTRRTGAPSVALGLRGGPLLLASDRLVAQLGGGAVLRFASALRPALTLEAAGIWPATVEDDGLSAQVRLFSLRLLPSLRVFGGTRGAIDLALAPGLDVISFSSEADDPRVSGVSDSRRIQPMLGARFLSSVRVSRLLSLLFGLGADYDFAPRRWVVATPSGPDEVLETARLRPYAYAGVGMTLFAGDAQTP